MQFVRSWAEKSRVLSGLGSRDEKERSAAGRVVGVPKPIWEPGLLDRHAGLTGKPEPDAARVESARLLPMHRYDWWATDAPGYPAWATADSNATKPEEEEETQGRKLSPSTFPPWLDWDVSAPVEHVQIRFGADEVARMKQAAQASLPSEPGRQQHLLAVSRLDALLAHMWVLINRARRHQDTREQVYMDMTLGLRSRVEPPLPDGFVGSPILLGHVSLPGSAATSAGIGPVAVSIRQMMSRFTPGAVSAHLHDAAHEVSPQRLWQAFLGARHTLVTSWTRAGCYGVDFVGDGQRPRYVQGRMPRMDGLMQVVDFGEGTGDFDVSLCLERGSMGRLLGDGMLRAYEL